jgi:hypothetical protein
MEMEVSIHIILLILYLEHRNHLNSLPIRHAVPVPVKRAEKSNAKSRAERASNLGGISIDATSKSSIKQIPLNPDHTSCFLSSVWSPIHAMQIIINALPALIFSTAELLIRK